MMHGAIITQELDSIQERSKRVTIKKEVTEEQNTHFLDISFYLIDQSIKDELLALGKKIGNCEMKADVTKALYPYAKLINAFMPAYKYSFFVKKRAVEIFDPEKVKKMLLGEAQRFKNKERVKLKEMFKESPSPISDEEQKYLSRELEDRLCIDEQKIKEVFEDFESYSVVITNHEHCNVYPSLYYTLDLSGLIDDNSKKKDYKKENTHLRSGVPNFLWFDETRTFAELRANNKIEKIIATHTAYCDTIYIQKL